MSSVEKKKKNNMKTSNLSCHRVLNESNMNQDSIESMEYVEREKKMENITHMPIFNGYADV